MSLRYGIIITILIDVLKNIAVKFYLEAFVYFLITKTKEL